MTLIPTQPSGFGCPCHGGQYDNEGNRTAGPPVRALDRYAFSIRDGNLFVGKPFSVSNVEGTGATARIYKWNYAFPGVHVDGVESWLYPIQPPELMATPRADPHASGSCTRSTGSRSARASSAAVKYFLFRKVAGDVNWFQTLGSATLTAFIVQAVTGVILAMYYKPDPKNAYASIQYITNDLWAGWLVRGMHRWGASAFIILMFLHMGRVFLFGAYKYPRELNWIIGVLLLDARPRRGLHRLPAAVGPDGVLGDHRRDQHQRDGAVPGAVHRAVPAGRGGDQRRHAQPLLRHPHARAARRADRADHAAHVPRDPPRRDLAAVVEASPPAAARPRSRR